MKRKIIHIEKDLCNGCGLCVTACHEGAIQMIEGKAKLVSDQYCDGLGDCLPACPTGAITMIEREAEEYNEELVLALQAQKQEKKEQHVKSPSMHATGGCPGMMAKRIAKNEVDTTIEPSIKTTKDDQRPCELNQWPIQLTLVNPKAEYFRGANLLVAADCTAFAYGDFHRDFIKNHITVIGCPKLDDNQSYIKKLAEILTSNEIKSITVVRMQVPCCGGIVKAVKEAMLQARVIVPYHEVTISIDGKKVE